MPSPQDMLKALNGRRFTARHVMKAAPVTTHTLTNITAKTDLRLFSESAGQGRPRAFCLIDVYVITLFDALSTLIGSAKNAAAMINELVVMEWLVSPEFRDDDKIGLDELVSKHAPQVCEDIFHAAEGYTARDLRDPFFIVADYSDFRMGDHRRGVIMSPERLSEIDFKRIDMRGAVVINMTKRLVAVDEVLFKEVSPK